MPSLSASSIAGERRQVTVMFCDLVGSTSLSERLDAEDLAGILLAYRDTSADAIARFGGYVAQFMGDGILAYFGYPEAHEDDAERAVRAGLEILTRMQDLNQSIEADTGTRLATRVGIHTGPAVVGEAGDPQRPGKMIFGDTPNLAARIQTAAGPNSVQISEATYRLLRTSFVTVDLGLHQLKGVSRPMRLIRVIEPSVVGHRLDWTNDRVPLVGRDTEMALLLRRWEEGAVGKGRAVCISGEAGVGKSRLVRQLRIALSGRPHLWLECFCAPLSSGTPFYPAIDLIKEAAAITYGDSADQQLLKLERAMRLAGFAPDDSLPRLAALFGLPLDGRPGRSPLSESPEIQRRQTIETLVDWTLRLTTRTPLVLCLEDLHWSDPSTLELIGLLLERSMDCALLCLFTHRPEFVVPWSGPSISSMPLAPLSHEESRQLARAVAHGAGRAAKGSLQEHALDQVADRADGNPLYILELVKTVAEVGGLEAAGLDERSIPPTLRDSLTARLDRLGPARQVAQLASALGPEIALSLLDEVSEQGQARLREELDILVNSAILEARITPAETFYRFQHALIQEAAYFSLLRRERRKLHARVAAVLEE
ncbi:MAG TPA: adenylate/guanylate cyclase domain-containing protein, partial [Actinomycetota bacterium]|nr:adenylate/guanylate cyclase domain-containing protein [Actinomycetota bacterium]